VSKISSAIRDYIRRFTEAKYFFPTICVVLLGLVWATTLNLIRAEYATARETALTLGHELLGTYEAQSLRSLREIDHSLKIIRYAYEAGMSADTLQALEARDLLPSTLVFSVCIVDQSGEVISSTDTGYSCTSNHNLLHALQKTDSLVISNPQESTESILSFGTQLHINGSAAGAVIITVEPAYFVSGYESQKYGTEGLNGLLGTDGVFRVLRIGDNITAGATVDINPSLMDQEANGAIQNYHDGIKRYTFMRHLFGYPLIAMVSLAEHEQLAAARKNAEKYLIRATAGSLFLIIVFAALFRESWGRKQEHEQVVQVEYIAYHDTLTGLPNRGLFSKLLQQALMLAKRNNRSFSVLFLDLDGFKHINDTLGHDAGDQLLIEVSERLTECLRSSDVVARIGGDEFVALLPNHKGGDCAEAVAQKIITAIAEPHNILGHKYSITISVGISMYPRDGQDEHTLMKNADIAMYYAKSHGKNSYRFYSPELKLAS